MATFVPFVQGARTSLEYSQADGSLAVNRLYWYQESGPFDVGSLDSLLTALASQWGAHIAPQTAHDVTLVTLRARALDTVDGAEAVLNPTSSNVGTDTDSSIALGLTKAFTLRTGVAGISFRGRVFHVGVPSGAESDTVVNGLTAGWLSATAAAWFTLLDNINTSNSAQGVVASYFEPPTVDGKSTPRTAAVGTPITSVGFHDSLIDFQRRRAPGHNRHR